MKDSTKKWLTITGGLVICAILVFVISQKFTKDKPTDDLPPVNSSQQGEVVVDPDGSIPTTDPDASSDINENDLTVNPQTPSNDTSSNAGNGAVSSGTEQTIQADPVKPESPEKPEAPSGTTTLPDDHDGTDVPEEERKTEDEAPPTYEETPTVTPTETEPAAGSTNSSGQVYVPGFGYVENSGENQGGTLDDMYENGNKIGIMGGE